MMPITLSGIQHCQSKCHSEYTHKVMYYMVQSVHAYMHACIYHLLEYTVKLYSE